MQKLTQHPRARRVMFRKRAAVGSHVFLAGDFNGWSITDCPMIDKDSTGIFACSVRLEPGVYQYKFVVDGVWCLDESNPGFVVSDIGTCNNVVEVKGHEDC